MPQICFEFVFVRPSHESHSCITPVLGHRMRLCESHSCINPLLGHHMRRFGVACVRKTARMCARRTRAGVQAGTLLTTASAVFPVGVLLDRAGQLLWTPLAVPHAPKLC